MANIQDKINQIRTAIFGKEVRGALADGIEAINKEVESTTGKQSHLEETFDQLVINAGTSNAEIVDARVDKTTGQTYQKLGDRLDKHSEQMDSTMSELSNVSIKNNGRKKQVMVTFTDDDCCKEVYSILKPLYDSKGIKGSLAIYPNAIDKSQDHMTKSQLLEMVNNGCDLMWHGFNEINFKYVTIKELEIEYLKSIKMLNEWGIANKMQTVAYPQGDENLEIRTFSTKYFKAGVDVFRGCLNTQPYGQYVLGRIPFGEPHNESHKNAIGSPYNTDTYEYYKWCVDKAIADGSWLIFMTHAWYESFNATQRQYFLDIVDYIKSKNIEIVTISEGINKTGNLVQIGDYNKPYVSETDYFVVGANGSVESNMVDSILNEQVKYTINTLPKDFPVNRVSKTPINYSESNKNVYPDKTYGVLETNTTGIMMGLSTVYEAITQIYRSQKGNLFVRNSNNTGTGWGAWKKCTVDNTDFTPTNTYKSTTKPNEFELDKITYTQISPSEVALNSYPAGTYGLLETNTLGIRYNNWTNYELVKQKYIIQGKGLEYYRSGLSTGEGWTPWKKQYQSLSGFQNLRPTDANVGEMYFDTTFNKPIWRNKDNTGWVDSSGNAI